MTSPKVLGYSFDSGRHFSEPYEVESVGMRMARQCAEHEAAAIETALARWCAKTGLAPAELGKLVGYTVERDWPQPSELTEKWTFRVGVKPVALCEAGEVIVERCL